MADLELSQQLLKLAQDRKQAGVATGLDVTREEVQLENTRQRLLVAQKKSIPNARMRFSFALS